MRCMGQMNWIDVAKIHSASARTEMSIWKWNKWNIIQTSTYEQILYMHGVPTQGELKGMSRRQFASLKQAKKAVKQKDALEMLFL